jgi:hypothetical protein
MSAEQPPPDQPPDQSRDRDGARDKRSNPVQGAGRAGGDAGDAGAVSGTGQAAGSLTLADVAEAVMELGRTVTELAADLEDLQARKAAGGPWWNTDTLRPADAERLRGTIIAFGDYLQAVYAITPLPHRWEDDPALLAELSALYVGWIGAYREPRANTTAPLQWHEALHRAIDRIGTYQDRRRQHDSVNPHARTRAHSVDAARSVPPLPVAFIPEPATDD